MSASFHPGTGWIRKLILRCSGEQLAPSAPGALTDRHKDTLLYTFTNNKSTQCAFEGEVDAKGKILLVLCLVNMTPFVQRPGLRTAQEQALQIPLAWSPLPLAPISLGARLRDSTTGLCHQLWGAAARQSPEKGNTLQSRQFSGTSHPYTQQSPGATSMEYTLGSLDISSTRMLPAGLLLRTLHTRTRTKDNLAPCAGLQQC